MRAPYDLPKPPTSNCRKDFCKNCGRCYEERLNVIRCDCWRTGMSGDFCEKPAHYAIWNTKAKYGKLELNLKPPRAISKSQLRFAFQTFNSNGPLVCLVAQNGKYWKLSLVRRKRENNIIYRRVGRPSFILLRRDNKNLFLHFPIVLQRNGFLVLSVNGKEFLNVGNLKKPLNDGKFHVS